MASPNIGLNGFFGNISGPFAVDEEVITKIQGKCSEQIGYLSKIGIHYVGDFDFDISNSENPYWPPVYVIFNDDQNNMKFQIGKTRMLELQDVEITSIKFPQNMDDRIFIDYQYISKGQLASQPIIGTAIIGTAII